MDIKGSCTNTSAFPESNPSPISYHPSIAKFYGPNHRCDPFQKGEAFVEELMKMFGELLEYLASTTYFQSLPHPWIYILI